MRKKETVISLFLVIVISFISSTSLHSGKVIDRVLAQVNDEQISLTEFEKVSGPLVEEYKKKMPNATDEQIKEFKESILSEMVNNKLIVQEAKKRKIVVTPRQIEEQEKKIKSQFSSESEFKKQLEQEGMTYKKFKDRIKEQLMAEELTYMEVTSKISQEPTKAEIKRLLDLLEKKLNNETLKDVTEQEEQSIEQLSELIKRYFVNKKQQEKYNEWVKKLRDKSKVIINPIE
jgi:hypothetical protein